MKLCTRCVMPDTRPDIQFVDGVCSACIAHENRKNIDWDERMFKLRELVANLPDVGGFNCIVPSSGGKDSTYIVGTLLELGARPLVVTATTCHLTEIGRENIDNLSRWATTIEYSPNKHTRAKLNKLGLELVGDISWPEHVAINTIPFRIAKAMGIKAMFYGENPTREYGGPLEVHGEEEMTKRWISEFGGQLGLRPSDFEFDMSDYMLPTGEIPKAYFLGQFIPWDSRRNASVAEDMGMKFKMPHEGNWWEFENLDNAQTGLHDYFGYLKYGYNRASVQMSVDIRNGWMTRDAALAKCHYLDSLFPYQYAGVPIDVMLRKIMMSMNGLYPILDKYTNWNLFRRVIDNYKTLPILCYPNE